MKLSNPFTYLSQRSRLHSNFFTMAESSSDSEFEEFQLYRERDEWKDVSPVPQSDGEYPVVKIAYSEECMHLYDDVISVFHYIIYNFAVNKLFTI